jgi:hypothetical protein
MQRITLDKDLKHLTKISSKWIRKPNAKHKSIKFLENNAGKKI